MTTTKKEFIKMLQAQAQAKQEDNDRRRRLEGRLESKTLEMLGDLLPNVVRYNLTSNGNIKCDWFALNSNIKNLHIFTNNTIGITYTDLNPYRVILVIKATRCDVLRVKTADLLGKRLNLADLEEMEKQGKAKKYMRVCEALGL